MNGGDRLAAGEAGGHDVLDHQHLVARIEAEAPAQLEAAGGALDEHRLNPQRAAHFMADDDAAHRRRDDFADLLAQLTRQFRRQRRRQPAGAHRVHQHPGALQVIGAVSPRGEQEMPFEQGLAGAEFGKDIFFLHGWGNRVLELPTWSRHAIIIAAKGIALRQFFPRGA